MSLESHSAVATSLNSLSPKTSSVVGAERSASRPAIILSSSNLHGYHMNKKDVLLGRICYMDNHSFYNIS